MKKVPPSSPVQELYLRAFLKSKDTKIISTRRQRG